MRRYNLFYIYVYIICCNKKSLSFGSKVEFIGRLTLRTQAIGGYAKNLLLSSLWRQVVAELYRQC